MAVGLLGVVQKVLFSVRETGCYGQSGTFWAQKQVFVVILLLVVLQTGSLYNHCTCYVGQVGFEHLEICLPRLLSAGIKGVKTDPWPLQHY